MTWFIGIPVKIRTFDEYIPRDKGIELIPPEMRHLTLVYLGDLRPEDEILDSFSEESFKPFLLGFTGVRAFPSLVKPRYLVTMPEDDTLIRRMRMKVLQILRGVRLKDKYEAYIPHVSLVRIRKKANPELIRELSRIHKATKGLTVRMSITCLLLYRARGGHIEPIRRLWAWEEATPS